MSTSFLLLVVILRIVQYHALGLTCYQCSPGTDGCSNSKFSASGGGVIQVTSSIANVSCAKTVYASNMNAVIRYGPDICMAGTVAATNSSDGYTTYCCSTNYCNGSSMKSASVLLALAMATAVLSVFYIK